MNINCGPLTTVEEAVVPSTNLVIIIFSGKVEKFKSWSSCSQVGSI